MDHGWSAVARAESIGRSFVSYGRTLGCSRGDPDLTVSSVVIKSERGKPKMSRPLLLFFSSGDPSRKRKQQKQSLKTPSSMRFPGAVESPPQVASRPRGLAGGARLWGPVLGTCQAAPNPAVCEYPTARPVVVRAGVRPVSLRWTADRPVTGQPCFAPQSPDAVTCRFSAFQSLVLARSIAGLR
jgi:hypothetical protein